MRVAAITRDSVTEGPGLRLVIWFQGCNKKCPGCHNPETWDYDAGTEYSIKELQDIILNYRGNITLCGGEPLDQSADLIRLLSDTRIQKKNIWCYTGYTFDELKSNINSSMWSVLRYIDVLVEGRFEIEHRSMSCIYRGSTNQRLLDAEASYYSMAPVEYVLD